MGPRPLPRKQISGIQVFDVQVPIAPPTCLEPSGLAARCAGIPILAGIVGTFQEMDKLVGQVLSNKKECAQLRNTSLVLLLVIRDHWESRRSETNKLKLAVQRTESAISNISADLKTWATRPSYVTDAIRNERNATISEHKERLLQCIEYLSLAGILQDHDTSIQTSEATQASKTNTTTESPIPTSAPQGLKLYDMSGLVSAETSLDIARLAALCASVPGLPAVVQVLKEIHNSVERVSWNKDRCRKLSDKAIRVVFIVCDHYDHYDNERADAQELQNAIAQTIQNMRYISTDLKGWSDLSFFKSWYSRRLVDRRIAEHEAKLEGITKYLSLAAILQSHDKVATLQALLKTTANNSVARKKAEDELYRLRSARPGEAAVSTPPELACECVRLGTQPDYIGSRRDLWRGRWLDKQDVALIFNKGYRCGMIDGTCIRTFERAVRVWRKLDNPFVLRLYGWCKFEGETYLVSPWLRNRDVVRFLEANRNRDRKCLSLIYQIAQGLQYLHSEGIICGSLQPSNILVQDDGSAVLSDLSLGRLPTFFSSKSITGPQANVFRYQAPEVILDDPISQASDVYSWAMTALEVITGDRPYHTWRSAGALIAQIVMKNQTPTQIDYKSPVLDKYPELWGLFVRCWKREPKDRPTAKEIVDGLKNYPGLK